MNTINAKWTDCRFGIDIDKKLKLEMEIEFEGEEIPTPIQIILAFQCLTSIAEEHGMDEKELYSIAFKQTKGE